MLLPPNPSDSSASLKGLLKPPSLPRISGWSCLGGANAGAAHISSAALVCPQWTYGHWKEKLWWDPMMLRDWGLNNSWAMARYSPVHNFKVGGPLLWRLDHFACQTEEGRVVFKRLFAIPAVHFHLTCEVIPQKNNISGETRLSFRVQIFVDRAVSPCVLLGKAYIIQWLILNWKHNTPALTVSPVHQQPVWAHQRPACAQSAPRDRWQHSRKQLFNPDVDQNIRLFRCCQNILQRGRGRSFFFYGGREARQRHLSSRRWSGGAVLEKQPLAN